MNDVKLHLRNALVDHSYTFSGRRRDIDCAPTYQRTAVIDTNNDRTAVGNVGDAQSRDEWQSGMSGSQFVGIEFFAARQSPYPLLTAKHSCLQDATGQIRVLRWVRTIPAGVEASDLPNRP